MTLVYHMAGQPAPWHLRPDSIKRLGLPPGTWGQEGYHDDPRAPVIGPMEKGAELRRTDTTYPVPLGVETYMHHQLKSVGKDGALYPPHPGASRFRYGPWHIARAQWLRPSAAFDWDWWHEDYDGPGDNRAGSARNYVACINEINEHEDEA